MTTLTLTYRSAQQKIRAVAMPTLNWKLVYAAMAVAIACLLVFYIYLVNDLTRGSYLIKNYNRDIDKALAEGRALQTNFAESGFLGNVQDRVRELSFEKTTEVTYVTIAPSELGMVK